MAAISWFLSGESISTLQLKILNIIINLITEKLTKYNVWLFIGNSTWQPDTRVVRYRKLWNALKARGVEIPHFGETFEQMQESAQGLKFFGAKLISELSTTSVIQAIHEERCAYILALPKDISIDQALDKGWQVNNIFDRELLKFIAKSNGIILKAVGEFDDYEAGFVGIAKPELIVKLITR